MEKPARILVVDDDDTALDLVSLTLSTAGYEVDTALEGNEALRLIDTQSFDLVLLDIMMPGLSGLDVLQRLRDKPQASPPVVLFTARRRPEDQQEGQVLGAAAFLLKPVARGRLLDIIQNVLQTPPEGHASD